jgi:hypothetical protein
MPMSGFSNTLSSLRDPESVLTVTDEMRILSHYRETLFGSHFICFTGTKVRILTHKAMLVPVDAELDRYTGGHGMYARVHTHTRSTHGA